MGQMGVKLSGFCLNRIRPHVRVRSPPVQSKLDVNSTKNDQKKENSGSVVEENSGGGKKSGEEIGRRIMIVVDSSIEAKGALQWALTHTVQNQDMVILLYVTKPSKQGEESSKEIAPRVSEFLQSMKKMCQVKRPEVQIEVAVAEGKEKGPTIVEETQKQGVALLILGQKKHSMTWRLLMTWGGNRVGGGVVEYCIQNATCMALAVRRKSKKLGGYLITTKRHKDFWLLA
ncbi:Universal stress protein like [Actinidia chinensis var. chinensis]|uniref:Universal stress protein like n=1 Tax=Actinidia chinensis var. chinensis TaxID=1590841 RepID=A0A2R6PBH5_ACTCC|nr:Universal stress protein like [Actinidia chinensis var. chinensis]